MWRLLLKEEKEMLSAPQIVCVSARSQEHLFPVLTCNRVMNCDSFEMPGSSGSLTPPFTFAILVSFLHLVVFTNTK